MVNITCLPKIQLKFIGSRLPLDLTTSYSAQVDASWVVTNTYPDNEYGIVFDFKISPNGISIISLTSIIITLTDYVNMRIELDYPNSSTTPDPPSCINGGIDINTIRIKRNSSGIDLFINDCQLPPYTNSNLLTLPRPGFIGVHIYPSDFINGEAYFDNLTICTTNITAQC